MATTDKQTLTIRIGRSTLTFACTEAAGAPPTTTPITYDMKGGMSVAANLREAFKTLAALHRHWAHAHVLADVQAMAMPESEYHAGDADLLFGHTFSGHERETVMSTHLEALHAVVLFGIGTDLQTVVADHCSEADYQPVTLPVWLHLGRQADGLRATLYGYFHDDKLDVFAFRQQRFRFCNSFSATHPHDALFYLLSAFTQLGMKAERDTLVVLGTAPHAQWVEEQLKDYVKRSRHLGAADLGIADSHLPLDMALHLQHPQP